MRVSAKRAIAGQKGGIGSALARMKLENSARSRPVSPSPSNCCATSATLRQTSTTHIHTHIRVFLEVQE